MPNLSQKNSQSEEKRKVNRRGKAGRMGRGTEMVAGLSKKCFEILQIPKCRIQPKDREEVGIIGKKVEEGMKRKICGCIYDELTKRDVLLCEKHNKKKGRDYRRVWIKATRKREGFWRKIR